MVNNSQYFGTLPTSKFHKYTQKLWWILPEDLKMCLERNLHWQLWTAMSINIWVWYLNNPSLENFRFIWFIISRIFLMVYTMTWMERLPTHTQTTYFPQLINQCYFIKTILNSTTTTLQISYFYVSAYVQTFKYPLNSSLQKLRPQLITMNGTNNG